MTSPYLIYESIICETENTVYGNFKMLTFEMWAYIKADRTCPISHGKLVVFTNRERR
jgi:hypothetical protein